jgi:tetratricopeptide (TPR) repeat protein
MQLGHALIEAGRFAEAKQRLEPQVELLQQGNEWPYLPSSFIARARNHLAMKEREAAFAYLNRVQHLGKLCDAKLSRAEALLLFAEYHAKLSNKAYADAFLEEARTIEGLANVGLLQSKF